MDEELKNFTKVWIIVISSLSYTYYISSKIPKGLLRFISLVPIFYIFIILPFNLSSFHFCTLISGLVSWLTNFKLFLFAFDHGPLSPLPSKLIHFVLVASFPIKVKPSPSKTSQNLEKVKNNKSKKHPSVKTLQNLENHRGFSRVLIVFKVVALVLVYESHKYKNYVHPYVILGINCCHVYLLAELAITFLAIPAEILFGFELEKQFDEPYLATSLQDFWGRRWNIAVSGVLRVTIYDPVRKLSMRFMRRKLANLIGVMASFVVSGFMHELMYYHVTNGMEPTWEVTWFFVLQGFCTVVEKVVKDALAAEDKRWRLSHMISTPLTVGFVMVTGSLMFLPQLIRNGLVDKCHDEYSMVVNSVISQVNYFTN